MIDSLRTVVRVWPWRTTTRIAGWVLVGWLAFSALGGGLRGIFVAGPVALALFTFFLVGPLQILFDSGSDDPDRRWARAHPWQLGALPAALTAVSVFGARRATTAIGLEETVLSSAGDGLARGAIVLVVVGLAGTLSRRGDG